MALRYFNVFGPRQRPDSEYAAVIPRFISALAHGRQPEIYGDGSQTRDFTYVGDVVQANLAASTSKKAVGQVMNIACGGRRSLLDVLTRLEKLMATDVKPVYHPWRTGDVRHSQASIEKAQMVLGFSPLVDFGAGLQETVKWHVGNRVNEPVA